MQFSVNNFATFLGDTSHLALIRDKNNSKTLNANFTDNSIAVINSRTIRDYIFFSQIYCQIKMEIRQRNNITWHCTLIAEISWVRNRSDHTISTPCSGSATSPMSKQFMSWWLPGLRFLARRSIVPNQLFFVFEIPAVRMIHVNCLLCWYGNWVLASSRKSRNPCEKDRSKGFCALLIHIHTVSRVPSVFRCFSNCEVDW